MALFLECMQLCAQKVVDTADIVRDAIFRQLSRRNAANSMLLIDLTVPRK